MIGMTWENTLLASRILPPAYTPVEVATNRSQDASLILEQDGRLTLLVILTTAAGLAIVLLFFILLRIGCLRSNSCFGRYKDRHDRSPCLTTVVLDDCASIKSLATSQQAIQTTFIQTRSDLVPTSGYVIKQVDNNLFVESQEIPQHYSNKPAAGSPTADQEQSDGSGGSGSLVHLKSWIPTMKIKGLSGYNIDPDAGQVGDDGRLEIASSSTTQQPLETKSLCGSPSGRYGRQINYRQQLLADQKQQILARFGQHLPGFGFTQSKSSCLFEDDEDSDDGLTSSNGTCYSYRNGNQLEYMGGPYGYVDPLFGPQLAASHRYQSNSKYNNNAAVNGIRLENLDVIQRSYQYSTTPSTAVIGRSAEHQPPLLSLLPTLTRSAESLVVLSKEHRDATELDQPTTHYMTIGN